jgi:hypothetical protein
VGHSEISQEIGVEPKVSKNVELRFEDLTSATLDCDVTSPILVDHYRRFGQNCCFYTLGKTAFLKHYGSRLRSNVF